MTDEKQPPESRPDDKVATSKDERPGAGVTVTAPEKKTSKAAAKSSSHAGLWLFILFLLAGLGAGGWFGWQWYLQERAGLDDQLARQQDRIDRLATDLKELRDTSVDAQSFASVQEADSKAEAALRDRVTALEGAMEDLRDAAQGGRRDLVKSEVEFLLRIAGDELYLSNNVDAAIYALSAADDRLRQLADPALNPVRRMIADNLTALNAVAMPDTAGMAFKLGSLEHMASKLPLAQSAHERDAAREAAVPDDAGLWDRITAGFARVFSKLAVRHAAVPPPPLLSPKESFFLYRNLELQFASARAALLQGDVTSYRQSMELARDWLTTYFDNNDVQVKSIIADVSGLLDTRLQPKLPDITGTLAKFRELTGNKVRG